MWRKNFYNSMAYRYPAVWLAVAVGLPVLIWRLTSNRLLYPKPIGLLLWSLLIVFFVCSLRFLNCSSAERLTLLCLTLLTSMRLLAICYTPPVSSLTEDCVGTWSGRRVGSLVNGKREITLILENFWGKRWGLRGSTDQLSNVYYASGRGAIDIPKRSRNPGAYDELTVLAGYGVRDVVQLADCRQVRLYRSGFLAGRRITDLIYRRLENLLREEQAGLVVSLCFGDTSRLSFRQKQLFREAGLQHLLATSGTHLVLLLAPLQVIVRRLRHNYQWPVFLSILLFYCFLCSYRPGIVRAAFCMLYNQYRQKRGLYYDRINTLGLSALLHLQIDPLMILRSGFILSYSACYMLLQLPEQQTSSRFNFFTAYWQASVAVQIITCLWSLQHFQRLNLGALIWTLPLGILFTFIFPLAICVLFVGNMVISNILLWLSTKILPVLLLVLQLLLRIVNRLLEYALKLRLNFYAANRLEVFVITIVLLALLLIYWSQQFPVRNRSVAGIFAAGLVILLCVELVLNGGLFRHKWQVYFLDVGQGNSTLLIAPDDSTLLIDGGKPGQGEKTILPALNFLGIDKLDMALITHLHADHYGGIIDLLGWNKIDQLLLPSYSSVVDDFATLVNVDNEQYLEAVKVQTLAAGDNVNLGGEKLAVAYPTPQICEQATDLNDTSVVLIGDVGAPMLFTGDLTAMGEDYLLKEKYNLACTVLQIPHHGSTSSSTEEFIRATKADLGIISVGKNNYGHPSPEVLKRLDRYMQTMQTAEWGAIQISAASGEIEVSASMFPDPLLYRIYCR